MALSYTWGSETCEDHVVVNGHSVGVTANLGRALRGLQKYALANRLMLWADSICIDQRNLEERSHQVGFMNMIYRCAECVGVWLGEHRDGSERLMEKMKTWKSEYDRLAETHDWNYEVALASVLPSNQAFYGPPGSAERDAWAALNVLLAREWWRRAWIVQEATALSPSRILLFCGNSMVDWSVFRATLRIGYHISQYAMEETSSDFEQRMGLRLDDFRLMRESGAYVRLVEVLQFIRAFECRDPRDKVYASLGIAADVSDTDIVPDYMKSVEDVFTDVAKFSLSRQGPSSLDFLGLVVRPSEDFIGVEYTTSSDELPSWVPDLRMRCYFSPFEKYLPADDFSNVRAYNVAGGDDMVVRVEGRLLYIRGVVLDTIGMCWPVCNMNLAESGVQVERSWKPDNGNIPYVFGGTILDAFNHTLLADLGRKDLSWDKLRRGESVDWDLVDRDLVDLTPEEKIRRNYMLIDLKQTTFGRRLVRTRRNYIGLGPAAAKEGDKVCVFFGGQLLYVLRERESCGHYEFIGECYVHGVMNEWPRAGKFASNRICHCLIRIARSSTGLEVIEA